MANEAVLPVTKPCCKAWQKISISRIRPTNSSGLTRKLGSGSMSPLQNHETHNRQFTFVIFVTLWTSPRGGRPAASQHRGGKSRVVGLTVVGESLSGQIKALGMLAWFSKSAVADRFRSADLLRLE